MHLQLTSFLSAATPKNQSPVLFCTLSTPMNQSTQSASRAPTSLTACNFHFILLLTLDALGWDGTWMKWQSPASIMLPYFARITRRFSGFSTWIKVPTERYYPTQTLPSSGGWLWSRSCLQWSCDIWLAASSFSCSVSTSSPRPPT